MISQVFLNKFLKVVPLLVGICLLFLGKCFAQDPMFTQFYSNPIYLNPGREIKKTWNDPKGLYGSLQASIL